jgi:phosphoglycerol transferase MdoB-like AlkP superfamily enzyme
VITLPALLWISQASPHWLPELTSNIAAGLAPGGLNNAGPGTLGGRGIGMIISLQAVFAIIWNNVTFYTLASYLICGVLFVLWAAKTLRSGFSPRMSWLALAAISALAMLPVYHRTYDARLLVIAVPACAALWSEAGSMRRWAMWLNLAGVVLTGDLFWIFLFQITHYSGTSLMLGMIPAPVTLLAIAGFYLSVYLRSPAPARVAATSGSREEIALSAFYAQ